MAHRLRRPEQAKQIKERCSYCLKRQLSAGKVPFSCKLRSAQVNCSELSAKNQVPRECTRTRFYRERDVTLMVLHWNIPGSMVGKPLIGWDDPGNWSHEFIPNHSSHLANDIHLEPYGSVNHIPSTIGGNVGCSWQESRRSCWCTTLSPRPLKASALYYNNGSTK